MNQFSSLPQSVGPIRPRRRLRLHPARRVVADRDPDRGGHVGGDRGPAAGAARFRRRPLRGLASLHADDVFARLLDDRARADDRPFRHCPASGHLRCDFGRGVCSRRLCAEPCCFHGRPCADRNWRRNRLRADDGGHFALVRQAARGRGRHCRVRQLLRRNDLAASDEPHDSADRLAHDLCRHRTPRRRCLSCRWRWRCAAGHPPRSTNKRRPRPRPRAPTSAYRRGFCWFS